MDNCIVIRTVLVNKIVDKWFSVNFVPNVGTEMIIWGVWAFYSGLSKTISSSISSYVKLPESMSKVPADGPG